MKYMLPVLLALLLPGAGFAQKYESDDQAGSYLQIRLQQNGRSTVTFSVYDLKGPADSNRSPELITAAIRMALPCSLQNVRITRTNRYYSFAAECPAWAVRDGQTVRLKFDVEPLLAGLQRAGIEDVSLSLSHPKMGFSRGPAGATASRFGAEVSYYQSLAAASGPWTPLVFEYGYARGREYIFLAALLLFLAATLTILLIARRRSLLAAGKDPEAAWFGYWRVSRLINEWSWVIWFSVIHVLKLEQWLSLMQPRQEGALYAAALFFPVIAAGFMSHGLARQVWRAVRGVSWSGGDVFRQELFRQMASLWPLMMILTGLRSWRDSGSGLFAWIFPALLVWMLGAWAYGRAAGLRPHALMAGDLRQRIAELARKAGVKLNQVFVMTAGKIRMGNAFALQGNSLILTDYLLERISRREADCVAAHEIGHLKHRHQLLLSWPGFILIYLLVYGAISAATGIMPLLSSISSRQMPTTGLGLSQWMGEYLNYPLALVLSLLALYFLSRRCERSADEYAVLLTGDPEAMITALARLSRMNLMPLSWRKWDEGTSTHPSMMGRIRLIARRHDISENRLGELLAIGDQPVDRYAIPAGMLDSSRVYTTEFRNQKSLLILLATVLFITAVPLALAGAFREWHLWWPAYPAGLLLMPVLHLALANFSSLWGYPGLKRKLASRLKQVGGSLEQGNAHFIGFAPDGNYSVYENHTVWDIGFMLLTRHGLEYRGDQAAFCIPRGAIGAVTLETGFPSWFRVPDIFVHWRDQDGRQQVYRLHSVDGCSMLGIRDRTIALFGRMRDWHSVPAVPEEPSPLPLPAIGPAGGKSPREAAGLPAVLASLILIAMLVVVGGAWLGLPGGQIAFAWLLSAVSLCTGFIPIWRFRDSGQSSNRA